MSLARMVTFDGVDAARMQEIRGEMEGDRPPEGVPATELLVLHDPEAEQAVVLLFFESEEDYARGNEVLDAMPAGDTPGRRTSVRKLEVATHRVGMPH